MNDALQLNFDNLPLVEAAIRVSFRTPFALSFAILNKLQKELGEDFQTLEEISQIEAPPGLSVAFALGVGQLPGAILSGNKSGLRATIQQHMVATRWVLDPLKNTPYPRYEELKKTHWRVVRALLDAAQAPASIELGATNMSYVDFIHLDNSEDVLGKYFSTEAQVQLLKNASQLHKIELAWQEKDSVDLRFRLERVTAQIGDQRKEGYNLTTVAGLSTNSLDESQDKLGILHNRLLGFFSILISARAKSEWRLTI